MSEHWLYSQGLPAGAADWRLEGDEARHARVKRLAAQEAVRLFDGRGRVATARVIACDKHGLAVRIEAVEAVQPRLPRLTVAVSPPKGERLDWMLEKLTELGVAAIQPLECERSVTVAKNERMDRWQRRLIEAAKQAHLAWLPVVEPSRTLPQVLERAGEFAVKLVADTEAGYRGQGTGDRGQSAGDRAQGTGDRGQMEAGTKNEDSRQGDTETRRQGDTETRRQGETTAASGPAGTSAVHKSYTSYMSHPSHGMAADDAAMAPGRSTAEGGCATQTAGGDTGGTEAGASPILAVRVAPPDRVLVVIGPEGGFSDGEREAMRRAGLVAVSLGPTVLRTETAAIVAAGCLLAAADATDVGAAARPAP